MDDFYCILGTSTSSVQIDFFPLYIFNDGKPPIAFIDAIYISLGVVVISLLVMIFLDYKQDKKVYASYILALFGTIIITLLIAEIGTTQW